MSLGAFLFWLAYRGHNFGRMFDAISEVRWGWVAAAVVLSVAAHYSRALRWGLLLEPFGYRPRRLNLFFAVMVMYLANMAIPRSGEVARCGVLAKYERISFSRSLGTVVTERIADVIVFACPPITWCVPVAFVLLVVLAFYEPMFDIVPMLFVFTVPLAVAAASFPKQPAQQARVVKTPEKESH